MTKVISATVKNKSVIKLDSYIKTSSVYGSTCALKSPNISKLPVKLKSKLNKKNKMNGLDLMNIIPQDTISTAFFDPQYRGILEKMGYGNEGVSRGMIRSSLTQMDEKTIKKFIKEISRILIPSGHLFLWVDKFHICDGVAHWFNDTNFEIVDMITWNKEKMGMGYRTRRCAEYVIIVQKLPKKAKNVWKDHGIRDVWSEKIQKDKKNHTHAKPINLQARLIDSTTPKNGIVFDPASGGYSVMDAAKSMNRIFLGCDVRG